MRITQGQRQQTEARIYAAMDRLLRGDLPAGGKCDVRTLAAEARVSRNGLYTTYAHLKQEFEQRRDRLRETGVTADPRQAQIDRLKADVTALKERIADRDAALAQLTAFRTTAFSQLAAQHDEIGRLRAQITRFGNVRALRPSLPSRGQPG